MYVINEAYDDNTALVIDLSNYTRKEMSELELIRFASYGNEVLQMRALRTDRGYRKEDRSSYYLLRRTDEGDRCRDY